jgi:uncharacterized protein (DUF1330 family)
VVEIDIQDPVQYEEYKRQAPHSIAEHGGHYLARGGACQTLEGDWAPQRLVILEFPNAARARAWWESESYREPKALRQRTAQTRMVLIEGT